MAESPIPIERIASRIYLIRGQKVMIDSDLAQLYRVTTSALNQQVKRNLARFPQEFSFELTRSEFDGLISQTVISKPGRGGRRKPPRVFTEHGVAMLSSVLRSDRAAQINIAIIKTFIRIRRMLASNEILARKVAQHDRQISLLFDQVQEFLNSSDNSRQNKIGFLE